MRIILVAMLALVALPVMAVADSRTLTVTLSYRERIAPPPGAWLDVQLLGAAPIAAQRVAVSTVPVTVDLNYDPQAAATGADHWVLATLSAPDGRPLFRGLAMIAALDAEGAVEVLLRALDAPGTADMPPRSITGAVWTVTEVFGQPWDGGEPGTLSVDDDGGLSIFAGCNRFRGRAVGAGGTLVFPDDMAGTLMACPGGIEARERRFLAALRHVTGAVRIDAGLVLTDAAGRVVLRFAETPD